MNRPADPTRLVAFAPRLLSVLAFAALAAASGCGPGAQLPEEELFREASLALEDESYNTAITSYKKLLEEYPFSDKAEIASLNIAYAHYLTEEYPEAIAAFNDFERLYPVSPLLPFVGYTIGMCWLDQAKDATRDSSASAEALRQFQKVANEFPKTIYADLAQFRQQQARENLAAHELLVGDYYRDRKRRSAAEARYNYVLKQYPTTETAARAATRLKTLDEVASAETADAEKLRVVEKTKEATVEEKLDEEAAKSAAEAKKDQQQGIAPGEKVLAEPPVGAPGPDTPPADPTASKPVPPPVEREGR
jgi:outer membrane protein assembly factor BamD